MDNALDYNQQKHTERQKADTFQEVCWISKKFYSECEYESYEDGQAR